MTKQIFGMKIKEEKFSWKIGLCTPEIRAERKICDFIGIIFEIFDFKGYMDTFHKIFKIKETPEG